MSGGLFERLSHRLLYQHCGAGGKLRQDGHDLRGRNRYIEDGICGREPHGVLD